MSIEILGSKCTPHHNQSLQLVSSKLSDDIFRGIWVPLITPFKNNKVDFPALQNLAADMIRGGIHGLIVCGTTGEALSLSEQEQLDVLVAVKEIAGTNYPIVMGINDQNTTAVVDKISLLNHFDLAGFLISVPYYVKPSQKGILMHFHQIANASAHPIILYNNPSRTGINMEVATVTILARDPRIIGIKESNPDITQLQHIAQHTELKVFAGDDSLLLKTINSGGIGAISAAAHIRPDLYVKIYDLVVAGKHTEASALFNILLPLIQLLFIEPNPSPIKALLAHQGKINE